MAGIVKVKPYMDETTGTKRKQTPYDQYEGTNRRPTPNYPLGTEKLKMIRDNETMRHTVAVSVKNLGQFKC